VGGIVYQPATLEDAILKHGWRSPITWARLGPLVVLAACPLAIGSVHYQTIAVLQFTLAVLLFVAIALPSRRHWRVPRLFWGLLAVALYSALQTVPLPASVLETIAPATFEMYDWTLTKIGLFGPDAFRPLSLAPSQSLHRAGELLLFAGFFLLFYHYSRTAQIGRWPLYVIVAVGVFSFLLGLVQTAVGTDSIFFLYRPMESTVRPFTATFVNPNHQAGFYGLAGFTALGLFYSRGLPGLVRSVALASAIACFTGMGLTLSRAALVLFFPTFLMFFLLHARRHRTEVSRWQLVGAASVIVIAAVLVAYGGYSDLARTWAETAGIDAFKDEAKFEYMQDALAMARDFPLFGIGAGAFPTVLTRYVASYRDDTASYVENEWIQSVVDWGMPVGLLAILVGAAVLYRGVMHHARDASGLGAATALVFIGAHNLADFSLQFAGVGVPALALLAHLLSRSADDAEERERKGRAPRLPRAVMGGLAATCLAMSLWTATNGDDDLVIVRRQFAQTLDRTNVSLREARTAADAALDKFPADYITYTRMALFTLRQGKGSEPFKETLSWVNGALYLHPQYHLPHELAGWHLYVRGAKRQALQEFKAALDRGNEREILRQVLRLTRNVFYPTAIAISSPTASRALLTELMATRPVPVGLESVLRRVRNRYPGDMEILEVSARGFLTIGLTEDALTSAEAAEAIDPTIEWPHAVAVRVRLDEGDAQRAAELADEAMAKVAHPVELASLRARTAFELKEIGVLDTIILRFARAKAVVAECYLFKARLLAEKGMYDEARDALRNLQVLNPKDPGSRFELAQIYQKAGRYRDAAVTYNEIVREFPEEANKAREGLRVMEAAAAARRRRYEDLPPGSEGRGGADGADAGDDDDSAEGAGSGAQGTQRRSNSLFGDDDDDENGGSKAGTRRGAGDAGDDGADAGDGF
jgi:tetratricopeptide (TPR) repeat protein